MKTRRLGRTELQISELVFGGGWVGGLLIHGQEADKRQALLRAWSLLNLEVDAGPRKPGPPMLSV